MGTFIVAFYPFLCIFIFILAIVIQQVLFSLLSSVN